MKYVLIIPDGWADEPQDSLGGKTPLEAAGLPAMDAVAAGRRGGPREPYPPALPAGSDVANLSLLGYNPLEHFTGRAPLEAAAQGIGSAPTIGPSAATSSPSRAVMRDIRPGTSPPRRPPRCWKPSKNGWAASVCSSIPA